jgi:hypothetical protein
MDFTRGTFKVLALNGLGVDAKYLIDSQSKFIINPITDRPYIVPADFSWDRAIGFARSLNTNHPDSGYGYVPAGDLITTIKFGNAMKQGGEWDLQRSYNGMINQSAAPDLVDGANFVYAAIGRAAGFTEAQLSAGGGIYNKIAGRNATGDVFGNSPDNVITHRVAFDFVRSDGAPADILKYNKPFARCFIAGTLITMADGTKKPIEEIDEGDMVLSFEPDANNGLGAAVPGKVTRTFQNSTRVLLDVCGLRVTPGHEFLSDNGQFLSIANILRQDRAFVRDVDGKGVPFRARTGSLIGSDEDVVFATIFNDPRTGALRYANVRGCKMYAMRLVPDAPVVMREPISLINILRENGLCWTPDGVIVSADGKTIKAVQWPQGRTPFDTGDDAGAIVTLDGESFTPDWIANIPHDGEEIRAVMNAGGGPDDSLLLGPGGVVTMKYTDGKGVFSEPAHRQTLPAMRPTLAATNYTVNTSPMNRALRRKQSALTRVK